MNLIAQTHGGYLSEFGFDLLAQAHDGFLATLAEPIKTFKRGWSVPAKTEKRRSDDDDVLLFALI